MNIDLQDRVCDFVRDIISARTGEAIEISARPEQDERNRPVVEQLWASPTRRYAIEHTRVEAFEGQIANQKRVEHLGLMKRVIADRLGGYFTLAVRDHDLAAARLHEPAIQIEIARLVLEGAPTVRIGETVSLRSNALPFTLDLHLRHRDSSALILIVDIHGDPDALRLARIRRALDDKCPKLKTWSGVDGRTSVLALESDDFQHSNVFVIYQAVQQALKERNDLPDIVVLAETDAVPMNAWALKEGDRFGDDVPGHGTGFLYVEGAVRTGHVERG